MQHESFKAGEIIFREGDRPEGAYWVLAGAVEISIATPQGPGVLSTLGEGELFGEMGMIDDRPRSATVRAVTDTELERIDEEDFLDEVLRDETRLHSYLATLFERLRMTDSRLQREIAAKQASPANTDATPARQSSPTAVGGDVKATFVAAEGSPSDLSVRISKFPFRIGRRQASPGVSPFVRNDLSIDDARPHNVSRNHCMIEQKGDCLFLRDRGSRLGTWVNGKRHGIHFESMLAELHPGENSIVLGEFDGNQHYKLIVGG